MRVLRVLVVEDDAEKLRQVLAAMKPLADNEGIVVDDARDSLQARRLLEQNKYDLLIVDIALPERPDERPSPRGGIKLVREILERDDVFNPPNHIVGLTAYSELIDDAGSCFADDLWLVLLYDPSSDEWRDRLRRKLIHLCKSVSSSAATPAYETHLCVVTALEKPELRAVLRLPWHWQPLNVADDATNYFAGKIERDGTNLKVVAAAAPRMGMAHAAALSMKMIALFRPRYIACAGIMAGLRNEVALGDVIAANPSWDWGSGKHQVSDGVPEFVPAPHQIALNSSIRSKLSLLSADNQLLEEIRRRWSGPASGTVLNLHMGPVASGAPVLANGAIAEGIRLQNRKLIGIEMETYGVFVAADEGPRPAPKAFSLKGVSDFADSEKGDHHRDYAAYTSAEVLRAFVEACL
jgi:nucleoside phosphorylase